MKNKPDLILIGGGGHCKACIDVVELEGKYNIVGILDNSKNSKGVFTYPCIGGDDLIPELADRDFFFFIVIGQIKSYAVRKRIGDLLEKSRAKIATIISPLAYVSKHAQVEAGVIVMHHAVVNAAAKVGKHSIINTFANIEHDVEVQDYCHISTGAIVNGSSCIGFGSFVGSNSTISNNVLVNPESIISAGSFYK